MLEYPYCNQMTTQIHPESIQKGFGKSRILRIFQVSVNSIRNNNSIAFARPENLLRTMHTQVTHKPNTGKKKHRKMAKNML